MDRGHGLTWAIGALSTWLMSTTNDGTQAEETIETVVSRTQKPLLLYLTRLLNDPEEALDVLQETYAKAITEPSFLSAGFKRKGWLYRVAGNLALSHLRRLRRWLRIAPRTVGEVPAPIESVVLNEERGEVQKALSRVKIEHRQILLLRFYLDLSYSEISETLSVPIGTVMSRLSRAKAELERNLK